MRHWRSASILGLGVPSALVLLLACAGDGETSPISEDAGLLQETSSPTVVPEATTDDAEASVDASVAAACSAGGFCYEPVPLPSPLAGVSALSADDAWAISGGQHPAVDGFPVAGDTILHWDGTSWKPIYRVSGLSAAWTFLAVWATKSGDVWALGLDRSSPATSSGAITIVRSSKDGGGTTTFRVLPTMEQLRLRGTTTSAYWVSEAADALWVIGNGLGGDDSVRRLREAPDGVVVDTFVPQVGAEPAQSCLWTSIAGFGPSDVYLGGNCGNPGVGSIAHYDGVAWTITVIDALKAVAADGGFDSANETNVEYMYATRPGETAIDQPRRLWIGTGRDNNMQVKQIHVLPVDDDGSVGAPLFTRAWDGVNARCNRLLVSALSSNTAWVSNGCLVHRWDGDKLHQVPTSVGGIPPGEVNGVWAGSADDAWIVGTAIPQGPRLPKTAFAGRHRADNPSGGAQP